MTPAERNAVLEEAAQIVMAFTETGPLRNVSLGARWVPRVAVAAAIRALKEQEPRPAGWGEGGKGDE